MSATTTRVVVNVHRSETCTYMFEGTVDSEGALALIGSGEYDPEDSNIRSEDIDVVHLEVRQL